MDRAFLVFILLSLSCARMQDKPQSPLQDEMFSPNTKPNANAYDLDFSLKVQAYTHHGKTSLMFMPKLDPLADYMNYNACQIDLPHQPCFKGTLDGVAPELRFDIPLDQGRIRIEFAACVSPRRAIQHECAEEKSITFTPN